MTEKLCKLVGFSCDNGIARCEGLSLNSIAKQFGTPLYVDSLAALRHQINDWKSACVGFPTRIFYAMKANANLGLLNLFVKEGIGFDIVSGGELAKAIKAGAKAQDIVYSGVGKTVAEIKSALYLGVRCINVESEAELERIEQVAASLDKIAPIAFRVNPNVDAKTHPYISTGLTSNKFGIPHEKVLAVYEKASQLPHVRISGIDCHIGSQITELAPFVEAAERVADLVEELTRKGIRLDHIDLGGGLGVSYDGQPVPCAKDMIEAVCEVFSRRDLSGIELFFEPGRNLVAMSSVLLTTVQYIKENSEKVFCIVDAGMSDMIRPSLYEAQMHILNTTDRGISKKPVDIVGPICESGDFLGKKRNLVAKAGDILVMTGAGAYGMSMASNYNMRPRCAEVLVSGDKAFILRDRETVEDLTRNEHIIQL